MVFIVKIKCFWSYRVKQAFVSSFSDPQYSYFEWEDFCCSSEEF